MSETSTLEQKEIVTVDTCFGPIEAYENDLITEHLEQFGNLTRPEFAFATSVVTPHTKMFDLGAHIGTFSMTAMAKMSSRAQILAVEGSPATAAILSRNINRLTLTASGTQIDERPHVTVLNALMVPSRDRFSLAENETNTGASRLSLEQHGAGSETEIPQFGIDQLVEKYFRPDYIKIDLESIEGLLLGSSTYVSATKPLIYMEVARHAMGSFGTKLTDLDAFMKKLGYVFYVNDFDRNGPHDIFRVRRINDLATYRKFFDVLCVPESSELSGTFSRYFGTRGC